MFSERFIRYIKFEKRYSPHTVSAYESDLDQFTRYLNNLDKSSPAPEPVITHPSQITYHDIRNWMVELIDQFPAQRIQPHLFVVWLNQYNTRWFLPLYNYQPSYGPFLEIGVHISKGYGWRLCGWIEKNQSTRPCEARDGDPAALSEVGDPDQGSWSCKHLYWSLR